MFRKFCILGAAAFLAIADAAMEMPRELTHHNKTSKTNTKSKNNKAKTKEVVLCLPETLDIENLPSYLLTLDSPIDFTQRGGAVYFWSPVYDCSDNLAAVSRRSHLVSSSDAPNLTSFSSHYQPKLTTGHGSG